MLLQFILELTALICVFYFLLKLDFSDSRLRLFGAGLILLSYIIYTLYNTVPFPNIFIITVILCLLFADKTHYIICLSTICTLCEVLLGYISVNTLQLLTNTNNNDIKTPLRHIDRFLYIAIILLSLLMRKKLHLHTKPFHEMKHRYYWLLSGIGFLALLLSSASEVLFLYREISKSGYYILTLSICLFSVALFATSAIMVALYRYNARLRQVNYLKQRCLELEQAHYLDSKANYEELRSFRHDLSSHILALQNLVHLREWDKLGNYINQLSIDKSSIALYNISTGNIIADAIINQFQHSLADGVQFKVSGQFQENCFVEDTDICIILSNLLNNAHEALEYLEKNQSKEIYLSISADSQKIMFMVENPSKPYTQKELELLQTTKSDKLNHGFGLSNVKQVAEKYCGDLHIKFADGFFTAAVILMQKN